NHVSSTAVSNEMAHVIAHHHGETLSKAFTLAFRNLPKQPVPVVELAVSEMQANRAIVHSMGPLARMQELEADALGLLLAIRGRIPRSRAGGLLPEVGGSG